MKKLIFSLFLMFCPVCVYGQSTTATFTITDNTGTVWSNGTVNYVFKGNGSYSGSYQWNGTALPSQYLIPQTVQLDGSGSGSFTVPSSSAIAPSGSTWSINVCPNASAICQNFALPLNGANQNISSSLTVNQQAVNIQTVPLAYSDAQIKTTPAQGGIYYNTGTVAPGLRYYYQGNFYSIGGNSCNGCVQLNPAGGTPQFVNGGLGATYIGSATAFGTYVFANQLTFQDAPNTLDVFCYNYGLFGSSTIGFYCRGSNNLGVGFYDLSVPLSRATSYANNTYATSVSDTVIAKHFYATVDCYINGVACSTSGSGGPPTGAAGGGLGGTYPNPTVNPLTTTINSVACVTGSSCTLPTGVSTRTCSGSTCYQIYSNGTIEEWGKSTSCGTGSNNDCSVAITLPYTLPTSVDSITVTPNTTNLGSSENNIIAMTNTVTTSSFNIRFGAMVYEGGGGNAIDSSVIGEWRVIGH